MMAMHSMSTVPPYRDLPAGLQLHRLQADDRVVVLSFSLGPLESLSGSELAIARLASGGLTNDAISRLRRTSRFTVATQMARVLRKLDVPCRVALALIPELGA
jgi:DNA-binding NarL/FixJ family response regulator